MDGKLKRIELVMRMALQILLRSMLNYNLENMIDSYVDWKYFPGWADRTHTAAELQVF